MRKGFTGDGIWFHRGKEARAAGQPREIIDARMSASNREAFSRGWEEEHWRLYERTPAQIAEANRLIAKLKADVQQTHFSQPEAAR